MTDHEFEQLSELAQFCKDITKHPQWANLCDYIQHHRIDPIEDSILNPVLNSTVSYEFFCYNDAINKGKVLGVKEVMRVIPAIISLFDEESERRVKKEAGPRKPGHRPQK